MTDKSEIKAMMVHRPPEGLSIEQIRGLLIEHAPKLTPIRDPKLKVRDLLLVRANSRGHYLLGHVKADPEGGPYFLSLRGSVRGSLRYAKEEGGFWVCGGLMSPDGIRRVEIYQ